MTTEMLFAFVAAVGFGLVAIWWLVSRSQARCQHDYRRRCCKCEQWEPPGGDCEHDHWQPPREGNQ